VAELAQAGLLALRTGERAAAACRTAENGMITTMVSACNPDLVKPDLDARPSHSTPGHSTRYSQNYSQNREYRLKRIGALVRRSGHRASTPGQVFHGGTVGC
jgi:hypothetical protein